jgi:hypothetical protein
MYGLQRGIDAKGNANQLSKFISTAILTAQLGGALKRPPAKAKNRKLRIPHHLSTERRHRSYNSGSWIRSAKASELGPRDRRFAAQPDRRQDAILQAGKALLKRPARHSSRT